MHLVLQKLISDTIKSGQKISIEMAKPIFSVLIQQTRQIRTCLFDLALKFKEQYDQGSFIFFLKFGQNVGSSDRGREVGDKRALWHGTNLVESSENVRQHRS